jgi:hypothetical protein
MTDAYLAHTQLVAGLVEDIARGGGASGPQLSTARRELAGAAQTVVDVAGHRWSKLLSSRSEVHRCAHRPRPEPAPTTA